jgi:hypothetical protein
MIPTGYHSPVPQFPGSVAVGDINGDGTLDLVITGRATMKVYAGRGNYGEPIYNTYTSGHVNVLLGNGDGTVQPAIVSSFPRQSYGEAAALANSATTTAIALRRRRRSRPAGQVRDFAARLCAPGGNDRFCRRHISLSGRQGSRRLRRDSR